MKLKAISLPKRPREEIYNKLNEKNIEHKEIQNIIIVGDNIVVYYWSYEK